MSQNLPNMLENTIAKIREMVDVNSVVGDPIVTPDGVTIIPVSKISVGLGGGVGGVYGIVQGHLDRLGVGAQGGEEGCSVKKRGGVHGARPFLGKIPPHHTILLRENGEHRVNSAPPRGETMEKL